MPEVSLLQGCAHIPASQIVNHFLALKKDVDLPSRESGRSLGIDATTRFFTTSHDVPNFQKDCLLEAMTQALKKGTLQRMLASTCSTGSSPPLTLMPQKMYMISILEHVLMTSST